MHVRASSDLTDSIKVDLRGVLVLVLPVQEGHQVALVDTVEDILELVGIIIAHLAGNVSKVVERRVRHDVLSGVHSVHQMAGEPELHLRVVGSQRQSAGGGVDVVVIRADIVH